MMSWKAIIKKQRRRRSITFEACILYLKCENKNREKERETERDRDRDR